MFKNFEKSKFFTFETEIIKFFKNIFKIILKTSVLW